MILFRFQYFDIHVFLVRDPHIKLVQKKCGNKLYGLDCGLCGIFNKSVISDIPTCNRDSVSNLQIPSDLILSEDVLR